MRQKDLTPSNDYLRSEPPGWLVGCEVMGGGVRRKMFRFVHLRMYSYIRTAGRRGGSFRFPTSPRICSMHAILPWRMTNLGLVTVDSVQALEFHFTLDQLSMI